MESLVISSYYEWFKIERNNKKPINYFVDKIAIPKPTFRNKYNFYVITPNNKEEAILIPFVIEMLKDSNLKAKVFKNGIIALITKDTVLFTLDMKKILMLNIGNQFKTNTINILDLTENEIVIKLDNNKTTKIVYALVLNLCNPELPFEFIQTRFAIN